MEDPLPLPVRLPSRQLPKAYDVGLSYNTRKGSGSEGEEAEEAEDAEAEYDSIDTIMAIKNALQELGCRVTLLEADREFLRRLENCKTDIVFNIAEGLSGRGREAHIPAILSFLGIPYTGSDETTLGMTLDKALTKRIVASYGIRTPRCMVVSGNGRGQDLDTPITAVEGDLKFPVIVKPNAEGSSKGIFSSSAIAEDAEALRVVLDNNLARYRQPMLLEEFITGREFTVAVVGNGSDVKVFPPLEIKFKNSTSGRNIYSFDIKRNFKKYIEYELPPRMDKAKTDEMMRIAAETYRVLECRDFSRIDFIMDEKGDVYFIEINPLPGLAPGYSDFVFITGYCGYGYIETIGMILNSALKRYGMATVDRI